MIIKLFGWWTLADRVARVRQNDDENRDTYDKHVNNNLTFDISSGVLTYF